MSVGVFLRIESIDTGGILIGGAVQANQCIILAEIKGCQRRDGIMGKRGIRISLSVGPIQHVCE